MTNKYDPLRQSSGSSANWKTGLGATLMLLGYMSVFKLLITGNFLVIPLILCAPLGHWLWNKG